MSVNNSSRTLRNKKVKQAGQVKHVKDVYIASRAKRMYVCAFGCTILASIATTLRTNFTKATSFSYV